jgi:hypothetical protein
MSGIAEDAGHEQRRDLRVTLRRAVSCEGDGDRVQSQFADISVGGMFIDTPRQPFPPGATITVKFPLTPVEPPVSVKAEVTYVQEKLGMGLRFVELEPEDHGRISRYVDSVVAQKLPATELHTRKSARVSITIPVVLTVERDGVSFEEKTNIITVSKHGACVMTQHAIGQGALVFLTTPSGLEFKASVVWVGNPASGAGGQIGVQSRGLAQALGFEFP